MDSKKEIVISFKGVFDYIRDKDLEIENWRYKHLKEFKENKKLQEQLYKIKEYIKNREEEYNNADEVSRSSIDSWQYGKLINDILELLEEIKWIQNK